MERTIRNRVLAAALFVAVLASAPTPAHAVSKEMIQLQTQVQQLLDMVQRLQSTMDSRFGVLQNLAQQTADQAKQMSSAVNDLQQKLNAQDEAINGKVDNLRGLKENVIMGRLVPAGTGMEYYRQVKIAGEDVVEEPVAEPALDAIPGYDEETRLQYAGGLPEDTGEESLAE